MEKCYIIFFILTLSLGSIQCSEKMPTYSEYMEENHAILEKMDEQLNFENLFEDELESNEIFFSSEEHAVSVNKKIEIQLLRYFVRNANVKYLLIEHSYAQSMKYNEYLKTGNDKILKECLDELQGTLSYTKQFYNYWKEVYKLNQQLEEKDRIWVVGIDLGWPATGINYLNKQLINTNLDQLPLLKDLLSGYGQDFEDEQKVKFYKTVLIELKKIHILDKTQLFETTYIINNFIRSIEAFSLGYGLETHQKRDQYIYENFLELTKRLPKGKFFGQWGLNHVYQSDQLEVNWLGRLLNNNEDSPVKGKVLSIATFYNDCERIKWRAKDAEILNSFQPNIDTLKINVTTNTAYLFRLNEPYSPFKRELLWFGAYTPDSGVTTDFFEYMIVANKYKASDVYQ